MHASICDDCWINLVGALLLLFGFVFSVLSVFSWKTKHSFILIENHPHFQNNRKFPHTDRNV